MFKALRLRFSESLGIDRAVFLAIMGKISGAGAGLITTLLIAIFFAPDMQGYYYTFQAVLAFHAFAELGLSVVLTYNASHEWAKLALGRDGQVTGDADALSRLTSLGRFALRWYAVAGALFTLVLTTGGLLFFSTPADPAFSWKGPWIVLCVVTGLNLCAVPVWALLEGCNQVSHVYGYRLVQYVASSFAAWMAIYLGAGLWVASIIGAVGLLAMTVTVCRRYGTFIRTILLAQPKGPRLNWRTDILPMQWRIAMSWIGGYFTSSLFAPVLFHFHGPVIAGQMGMTWVLVGSLMSVASSWIMPKAPRFGILIAQQKYDELDRLFWRTAANVLVVTTIGALGIWVLVFLLNQLHHPFSNRLLPPAATAYLLVAATIVSASLPMSTYLRAHKKEPLMVLSVIGGLLTGIAVVVLGKYYSADGVAIGYLAVMATVTPFVAVIWYRRRAEWHAPAVLAHNRVRPKTARSC
jgi:O-antigen/teichoic acid export membrane protein